MAEGMRETGPGVAGQLGPFDVTAEMHDGSRRALTVYGFGLTYRERLQDAREQALRHPALKGARVVVIR